MSGTPRRSPSPLLSLPGAVAGAGIDAPVAAHYGSLYGEQKTLEAGEGFVDLSHHDVVRISGPDRLQWLHDLTTQYFLDRMRFLSQVEVADVTSELALTWRPAAGHELVPRERLTSYAEAAGPACGLWAYEALRIARGEPRLGLDTDERTIPNEVGWIDTAVHMDKGCYRGQETVARVHNLGRPPRRLTLLHLDGSENRLPEVGSELRQGEKVVGFVGTSARHHELGPIALALVKRNVPVDAPLEVDGLPAAQEVIVDPEVGLHFRR